MKRTPSMVTALLLAALLGGAVRADAALLERQGRVTFLRVHDVGTGFGPPGDQIDVEVVFQLDTQPLKSFGFQVRNDGNRAARQGMLDLLRDAFNLGWTVIVDFDIDDPAIDNNGVAIRVALTGNQQAPTAHQYAAKFVCGKNDEGKVVAPGEYFTAINVGNPGRDAAAIQKRFAIALPGEKPGPVSGVVEETLKPGQAFEIDCPDIGTHVPVNGFAKGFVTIESPQDLEVVGVYTAANLSSREVVSEEVERVPERLVTLVLPDLLPVPGPEGHFCRVVNGRLVVTVRNQGTAPAAATVTEVDYLQGTRESVATPALGVGAAADVSFAIPAGFPGTTGNPFRITADKAATEVESNETNNVVAGNCVVIL
jgi:CARDB